MAGYWKPSHIQEFSDKQTWAVPAPVTPLGQSVRSHGGYVESLDIHLGSPVEKTPDGQ